MHIVATKNTAIADGVFCFDKERRLVVGGQFDGGCAKGLRQVVVRLV